MPLQEAECYTSLTVKVQKIGYTFPVSEILR